MRENDWKCIFCYFLKSVAIYSLEIKQLSPVCTVVLSWLFIQEKKSCNGENRSYELELLILI